jgi:hypothetical protein
MPNTAAPGSGLGSQVGTGIETAGSYGTLATINKWHAFESFEVSQNPQYAKGSGLRNGTLVRDSNDRVLTALDAGGTAKAPVYYNGLGRMFGSLMGSLGTTPAQQGGTTAYLQTHAFANTWQQSLSFQQLIADVNQDTTNYWNVYGGKVVQGDFDCSVGNLLNSTWTIDAQDRFRVTSGTTIVQPTANPPYAFQQMKVKIGAYGSETSVDGVTKMAVSIKRAHADKRFNAGNVTTNPNKVYGIKDEPVDNGFADITGTISTEYINDTLFDNYYQTETYFSLIWVFTSASLAGTGYPYSLSFNFPRCYFIKGDPTVSGPDVVKPEMPFEVWWDETHAPATISIVATDTTL